MEINKINHEINKGLKLIKLKKCGVHINFIVYHKQLINKNNQSLFLKKYTKKKYYCSKIIYLSKLHKYISKNRKRMQEKSF